MDPTLIPSDGSAAERPEETGGGLALDPDAEPSAVRLDALLTADPKFRRSWGQDRKDQSPTAYNLSLATMAMGVGWSDQEVVNLIICWRRKHGHDLKLGEGYYEIILSKAKEPIVMAQAQEQLEEALLLRPEDQSEVLKANLKTLFRVDIIRIVKYVGEPPVYYMYTKQGDITLGEISRETSPWERSAASPRRPSSRTWWPRPPTCGYPPCPERRGTNGSRRYCWSASPSMSATPATWPRRPTRGWRSTS